MAASPPVVGSAATPIEPDAHLQRYAARTRGMSASEIRALFSVAARPEIVSLAGGMPYVSALPFDGISELAARLVAERGATALQYGSGQGDPRLREGICEVMALQGIAAHADEIVVTVGSQQGLDLLTRIFCDPGDVVLAESPSYVGALGTFAAYEAHVHHVPTDERGIIPSAVTEAVENLTRDGRRVKFLYTVPNFQNPLGVTLDPQRRPELLEACARAGVLVVEDDPYGLLGFDSDPLRAMRADAPGQVVYLGSFSKTLAAGLRVGWVLAPHGVREKLILASEATVLCPPALNQLLVADYLASSPWYEQVKVFRELYRERRDAMLEALDAHMPDGTSWTRPDGGFYVWLTLPDGLDAKVMQPRAIGGRVAYVPGIGFYADGQGQRELRLSYCYPEPDVIREGVRRLAAVTRAELDLVRTFGARLPRSTGDVRTDAPAPDLG